jgi:methionyl-tRNA synthetase
MSVTQRKIFVSSALPYANGSIHMGHLVEYIQSDIWVRFQKLYGNKCVYICAADAHGTPIMIKAREEQTTPEELVKRISKEQYKDLKDFNVEFDNFYTTHSSENTELVYRIYKALLKEKHIYKKTIKQAYDESEKIFLPDRFIRGNCPRCHAKDQYGDACENCGATYNPEELSQPVSVLSNTKPNWKKSEHHFFRLSSFEKQLKKWIKESNLHQNITSKLDEWFTVGLRDWDISRDAPYFGINIPDTTDKYFYVWLDAPIGYLASFLNLCKKTSDLNFEDYWLNKNSNEIYHFIGKDIVYFHTLFWPAILEGSGFRKPNSVFAHGFLTINGKKMSKSRGTFIKARTYLDHLDPTYLRYYYAAKLGPSMEDIDLNFDDFILRVNSDLIGKLVNIASRCATFINKNFDSKLASKHDDPSLFQEFLNKSKTISKYFEHREFSKVIRETMKLSDMTNEYIDKNKPWVIIKEKDQGTKAQEICTQGLNLFRIIMIYLTPVLPELSKKSQILFKEQLWTWSSLENPLLSCNISNYKPLLLRIEKSEVNKIIEKSKI